jgi:hypothetical protein
MSYICNKEESFPILSGIVPLNWLSFRSLKSELKESFWVQSIQGGEIPNAGWKSSIQFIPIDLPERMRGTMIVSTDRSS